MSDKNVMAQSESGAVVEKNEVGPDHHNGNVVPARSGKRHTVARHCKRFWWLHLIIFICITILVVCLAIFVAVPRIAQSKINDAKLEIQGVNVLQTESDSYLMQINSTITTDGSISAKVEPFEGDMYLEDLEPHTPFATVSFPATNGDKHQMVNVSQHMNIKDLDAFTTFNVWFAVNDTLRVTIDGHTKVQPSGLNRKYGVQFKKTLTIKGLNTFKGTTLPQDTAKITSDPDVNLNFNGTTVIPNQSVFTLDIGNVSFTNFVNGQNVGTLYIQNMLLRPGDNTFPISAHMNQSDILLAAISPQYCNETDIPFELQGKTVTNHGQNLSYFAAALSAKRQTVPVPIRGIIKQDEDIPLSCSS